MNRRRAILGTVTLLAVLAAGFAAHEGRQAAVASAAARALEARRSALDLQFQAAQRGLLQERRSRLALEQQPATPAAASPRGPTRANLGSAESRSAWFAAHPEDRRRYLGAYRDGLTTTWGLLFKSLNLSPDQEEKLKDILTQREDNDITVEAAAAARGLDDSAPEIKAFDDQLDAANKAALRALLDNADYNALRGFMHEAAVIPLVDQLAGSIYATPEPLTGDQALALTQALADSSEKKASGKVIEGTVNWDQALAKAQAILSPGQASAFDALQQQTQSQAQFKRLMHSLGQPASAAGGN
jgi:hypothetical protein